MNNLKYFLLILTLALTSPVTAMTSAKKGMVVTEQHLASGVGAAILAAGGNAVDAAVATGYALAVVHPCCGNLGGGGFILLHTSGGKHVFFNFREKAPLAATRNMYLDKHGKIVPGLSTKGYLAVAVPGTVMGLETLRKKYGTMSRQQVMAPAIRLAEKGFVLEPGDIKFLAGASADFHQQPTIARIFLKPDGAAYQAGDTLVQKNLARTLKGIAKHGTDFFYQGPIAKEIVKASQQQGGILSIRDFSHYTAEELSTLSCHYDGYTLIVPPPPSSGGITLCEILNILDSYPLRKMGFHTAKSTHYIVEAMRYAFYDRNLLGDPDFVHNPVARLMSEEHADEIRQTILDLQATPSVQLSASGTAMQEGVNTTHYAIVDSHGNAVSATLTLNAFFGAKVIAGNTGFFLNDEMDDFTLKQGCPNKFGLVQGGANTIAPGKRPLSSMTPALLEKGGKIRLVLGSPGGPRIITAVLQTLLNVLDYHMTLQQAVDAPRYHHQWLPDTLYTEPHAFSGTVSQQLAEIGYHFRQDPPWGAVEAIQIHPDTSILTGANDKRRPAGSAVGVQ